MKKTSAENSGKTLYVCDAGSAQTGWILQLLSRF